MCWTQPVILGTKKSGKNSILKTYPKKWEKAGAYEKAIFRIEGPHSFFSPDCA